MTPEKKRLLWILIAILFFFANLTLMVILLINAFTTHPTAQHTPSSTPTTQQ